jgi:class 3 adenylate cyclase
MILDWEVLPTSSPVELLEQGRVLSLRSRTSPHDLDAFRFVVEQLLSKGEPLLAYELLIEAPDEFQRDARMRQFQGLALARAGATHEAQAILQPLCLEQMQRPIPDTEPERIEYEESLSLLGRTFKDMALPPRPGESITEPAMMEHAYELYCAAYSLRTNYYPGINAAFLAVLLGREAMARDLARTAREQCLALLHPAHNGSAQTAWLPATLGEACLILGVEEEARTWYGRAAAACRRDGSLGNLGSTVRQLAYLLAARGQDVRALNDYIPIPRIGLFTGHMIDRPGRWPERFPERLVGEVQRQIRVWLDREDVLVGYSSAASGADLLFIEALLERGGTPHIVLPFSANDFRERSVAPAGSTWTDRYDSCLPRSVVHSVSDRPLRFGEVAYEYANDVLHGLAIGHARQVSAELRRLAVWDGECGDGPGGTSDAVLQWRRHGDTIEVIPVPGSAPATALSSIGWDSSKWVGEYRFQPPHEADALGTCVLAHLFADLKDFSKLDEHQLPILVEVFLGAVKNLLDTTRLPTRKRNTWGDGLYIAFDRIGDAGRFALELAELMRSTNWTALGLPSSLSLRTALHAGPVYVCTDPVTGQPNCIGTHVSRAARLEPITIPNQVYASQEFAALAAAEGVGDFLCRYVGHQRWGKNYGVFPTYHVTRS